MSIHTGPRVFSLIRWTFVGYRVCTEFDRTQNLARDGHSSIWWTRSAVLNHCFRERVLLLCATDVRFTRMPVKSIEGYLTLAEFICPRGLTFRWKGCCGLCFWHLFCSGIYFCLYVPFNCISFNKFSRQLSAFSLCCAGLISSLLVLSTMYLFKKISFNPDIILCGWLYLKHELTRIYLPCIHEHASWQLPMDLVFICMPCYSYRRSCDLGGVYLPRICLQAMRQLFVDFMSTLYLIIIIIIIMKYLLSANL